MTYMDVVNRQVVFSVNSAVANRTKRDAGGDLEGVSRVDDEDPVAVTEERQLLVELCLPVGGGLLAEGGGDEKQKGRE